MDEERVDYALRQIPPMPAALGDRIREQIKKDTRPVKPLMSDAAYVLVFGVVFGGAAVLFASVLDFEALHIAPVTVSVMVIVIASLALWTGLMVARSRRPASGRVYGVVTAGVAVTAYEALVLSLFRSYSMNLFVHKGMTCLALGVLCAALASLPIWFVARRGFAVEPLKSGVMIGLLSGLAGLAALTLHCPVFEVPHVAVWHAAIIVVCAATGSVVSKVLSRN